MQWKLSAACLMAFLFVAHPLASKAAEPEANTLDQVNGTATEVVVPAAGNLRGAGAIGACVTHECAGSCDATSCRQMFGPDFYHRTECSGNRDCCEACYTPAGPLAAEPEADIPDPVNLTAKAAEAEANAPDQVSSTATAAVEPAAEVSAAGNLRGTGAIAACVTHECASYCDATSCQQMFGPDFYHRAECSGNRDCCEACYTPAGPVKP